MRKRRSSARDASSVEQFDAATRHAFPAGEAPAAPGAAHVAIGGEVAAFPALSRDAAMRRRRRTRGRRAVAAAVAVAVVGGGVGTYAATRDPGGRYRTAEVTTGDVAQSVSATGTVASADRDDAAFAVAGTVATVDVKVGDVVTAGQTLATLDPQALADAVEKAQADLTQAQQTLADNLEAQATGAAPTSSASGGSSTAGASSTSGGDARQTSATTSTADSASVTVPAVDDAVVDSVATAASAGTVASTAAYVVPASATPATTASASSTRASAPSSDDIAALQQAVHDAQQTLLDQYDAVNAALAGSQAAIDDEATGSTVTCAAFLGAAADVTASAADDTPSDGTPSDSPSDAEQATPTAAAGDDALADLKAKLDACTAALGAVQDGQSAAQAAQQQLLADAKALDEAVSALADAAAQVGTDTDQGSGGPATDDSSAAGSGTGDSGQAGQGPNGQAPAGQSQGAQDGQTQGGQTPGGQTTGRTSTSLPSTSSTPSTGTPSGQSGTQGSTKVTVSAEQILANQADVDAAKANLAVAQANATRTALTSRIAGTVAAVAVTPGSTASASTTAVTVLGTSGYLVDVTVPLAQLERLEAGQQATAAVAGTTTPVTGKVTRVGVVNQSQTSSPSYTVTVALDAQAGTLFDGSSAQVSVAVASASGVVVVPTSAVSASGNDRTVRVLKDGVVSTVPVEVGAVGPELTEITSGVSVGQQVVLADLSQAVTSDSDGGERSGLSGLGGDSGNRQFGGSFPGGGFPSGSFSGGGGFAPSNRG